MCRRRGLKVIAGKSKVMVLNGELMLGMGFAWSMTEFKYLGCVLDESGGEWEEGCRCYQFPSYC